MPAYARREIVDETVVGIYHCVSRCVRRAFLCGVDGYSGRNFDHRKLWIQARLEELAAIFSLDVLGFSVMSNHIHLVLRTRPDVAETWSDEEVARRWWQLHPWRRDNEGSPAEPEAHELAALQADPELLAKRRGRLASLSSFMGSLCEPIARRANREDAGAREGRFKSQAVIDEAGLLACSIYVDLNPIRARVADTPETSEFTGAFERMAARQHAAPAPAAASVPAAASETAGPARDAWLSPVPDADVRAESVQPASSGSTRRASDRGFLPISLDEYLELLDWTGRQIRADKRGTIRADLRPILERLRINADAWIDTIEGFGKKFRRAIGRSSSLASFAASRGKHWFHGVTASKLAFG